MSEETKTYKYRVRHKQLWDEFSEHRAYFSEIRDYVAPGRGRYLTGNNLSQVNDGSKKHQKIINGTASAALRVISAGMHSGLTSPSRPWLRLGLMDEELMEYGPVREYLHMLTKGMLEVFNRSNFYTSMHTLYKELVPFGVAAELTQESFDTVINCRPFTIGEYVMALDANYRPSILHRQFSMTARQMVEKFGEDNVSDQVKQLVKSRNGEKRFELIHVIQPNDDRDRAKGDFRGMAYKSVYFELAGDHNKVLRESGYKTIPFVAPRWDVVGVDTYGCECPGMDSHGDVKMLQKMEEKKLKGLDKEVDPAMNAPTSMRGKGGTIISGGVNFIDVAQGQQGFTPAHQVKLDFRNIAHEIDRVEYRINKIYFNDLFLMIANESRSGVTAAEIARKYEEKLLMLGPITERVHGEALNLKVDRAFSIMDDLGMIPPAPEEMEGMDVKVEYISLLAQAQKMVGLTGIEQVAGFVGNMASYSPEVVDKFDFDEAVDEYGATVGINPNLIRSDEKVAEIRGQRAQQQQAQQMQQTAMDGVDAAKTLSETKMEDGTALDKVMEGQGQ